jgi:CRP-like cAMP-binding protein
LADGAPEPEVTSVPADSIILELAMIVEAEANARFVAEGHARILKISRAKLLALLEDDPALAQVMSETLVERLSDMAQNMRDTIQSFAEATDKPTDTEVASPETAMTGDETDEEKRRSA